MFSNFNGFREHCERGFRERVQREGSERGFRERVQREGSERGFKERVQRERAFFFGTLALHNLPTFIL
jgi:hypothetical protein